MSGTLERINGGLRSLQIGMNSLATILQSRGGISENERIVLVRSLGIRAEAAGNPISAEEAQRINHYLDMVIERKEFTADDANEFKSLTEKYVADPEIQKKYDKDKLGILLAIAKDVWARTVISHNP